MKTPHVSVSIVCALILIVFGYAFWVGAQKGPREGGPEEMITLIKPGHG